MPSPRSSGRRHRRRRSSRRGSISAVPDASARTSAKCAAWLGPLSWTTRPPRARPPRTRQRRPPRRGRAQTGHRAAGCYCLRSSPLPARRGAYAQRSRRRRLTADDLDPGLDYRTQVSVIERIRTSARRGLGRAEPSPTPPFRIVELTDDDVALALRNPLAARERCARRVWPDRWSTRSGPTASRFAWYLRRAPLAPATGGALARRSRVGRMEHGRGSGGTDRRARGRTGRRSHRSDAGRRPSLLPPYDCRTRRPGDRRPSREGLRVVDGARGRRMVRVVLTRASTPRLRRRRVRPILQLRDDVRELHGAHVEGGDQGRLHDESGRASEDSGSRTVRRRAGGCGDRARAPHPGFSSKRCSRRCVPAVSWSSTRRISHATGIDERSSEARASFNRWKPSTHVCPRWEGIIASTPQGSCAGFSNGWVAPMSTLASSTTTCSSSMSSGASTSG